MGTTSSRRAAFTGTINFGGGPLSSAGGQDLVIWKQTQVFTHVWSVSFGGAGLDAGLGIVVDGSDPIIVTGEFSETVNVGGGDLVSAGGTDVFIAKLDADANHIWSLRAGGTGDDRSTSVDADGADAIVLTTTGRPWTRIRGATSS